MEKLDVKVGDLVIYQSRWNGKSVQRVDKITPKGNIRVKGALFDQFGYEKTSDSFTRDSIIVATKKEIEKIEQIRFVNGVFKRIKDLESISYDKAKRINDILLEKDC